MDNESPLKAVIVVTATALVCSILVTVTAVSVQPIQRAYRDLERNRYIVSISGRLDAAEDAADRQIAMAFGDLEARIVDLDRGVFVDDMNPDTFDARKAAADPELGVPIPAAQDIAALGRRARWATVYVVEDAGGLQRIIFPIYGKGMWSMLSGYLALESDLNTIAGIVFNEQGETAGIGDRILAPDWQARWQGRKLYDAQDTLRFRIAKAAVDPAAPGAAFEVDGLTGATVTADAVTNLVRYWFGPHGFARFIDNQSATGAAR